MERKPPGIFREGLVLRKRGESAGKAADVAYKRWAKQTSALCDKTGEYAKERVRLKHELLNMHRKGMRAESTRWMSEQLRRSSIVRRFNSCVLTHCRQDTVNLAKSRIVLYEYLISHKEARLSARIDDERGDAFTRKELSTYRERITRLQAADKCSDEDLMAFIVALFFQQCSCLSDVIQGIVSDSGKRSP